MEDMETAIDKVYGDFNELEDELEVSEPKPISLQVLDKKLEGGK